MSFYEGMVRLLWLAVVVGWAFHAASMLDPDLGESFAAVFRPSLALSYLGRPGGAPSSTSPAPPSNPAAVESICVLVESAAQAHGLPPEFFARLIWQESRFNPEAVGPATRNGQRAQGIAQFMPDTAKERGVTDPFDPVGALPKSAEFLRELRFQFGNLGLAAAAYNAGPKRVRDWLAGHSSLPGQTRSYVSAVTGRSADDWAALMRRRDDSQDPMPANRTSCGELIALLQTRPELSTDDVDRRPSMTAPHSHGASG